MSGKLRKNTIEKNAEKSVLVNRCNEQLVTLNRNINVMTLKCGVRPALENTNFHRTIKSRTEQKPSKI